MVSAPKAVRAFPQTAIYLAAAALLAIMLTAIVTFWRPGPLGSPDPAHEPTVVNPAVVESARRWVIERQQQSGYMDPRLELGREWERQREQQSPHY